MRRLMLNMSHEMLADQLGLTFQQVQKYKRGPTVSARAVCSKSLKSSMSQFPFFFEQAPNSARQRRGSGEVPSVAYINDFLASSDGLALVKAFMRIKDKALGRSIVHLVEGISGTQQS